MKQPSVREWSRRKFTTALVRHVPDTSAARGRLVPAIGGSGHCAIAPQVALAALVRAGQGHPGENVVSVEHRECTCKLLTERTIEAQINHALLGTGAISQGGADFALKP